jgi:hypothetical protein
MHPTTHSDYNLTVFSHSILGGAFGYILARAVTTRLGPSPRLFAGAILLKAVGQSVGRSVGRSIGRSLADSG